MHQAFVIELKSARGNKYYQVIIYYPISHKIHSSYIFQTEEEANNFLKEYKPSKGV